jgi:hypothetical protein
LRVFKKTPLHDWASHGADAFRYLAMAWREPMPLEDLPPNPIIEMTRKKTWAEVWAADAEERRLNDEELDEYADDFALSGNRTITLE